MLANTFKNYLDEILGVPALPLPWNDNKGFPFFLRDRYEFFSFSFLNTKCLLMVPKGDGIETPAEIRKHWEMVKKNWPGEAIYVPQTITSFNRKRLIQQKVPFIVPGNQMYLPTFGMDLREHFRKDSIEKVTFSPATQVIVLSALNKGFKEPLNVGQLAKDFVPYSIMTISRAIKEISNAGLGMIISQGRERKLKFELSKKELWEKAKPHLQNPVKMSSLTYDKNLSLGPDKIEAGLYALSHYSNLAEPREKRYALSSGQYKAIKNKDRLLYSNDESEQMTWLDVWSYDPKRLARNGRVDPFSLYLSLQKEGDIDERVHSALQEMMEKQIW